MAYLKGKTLFFVTSPRTPAKMVPEIQTLIRHLSGQAWNQTSQLAYAGLLAREEYFQGGGSPSNLALTARDRINRAPKALGFIDLSPTIALTEAGRSFLDEELSEEALLRQLLKFQLPSPYHIQPTKSSARFWVKPYLEILRLIHSLEYLTLDELKIFGMQLIHYKLFEQIQHSIVAFRNDCQNNSQNYREFAGQTQATEIARIYHEEFAHQNFRTRQSQTTTAKEFIQKKASNLRDYADACIRYLRATGVIAISQRGHSVSILPERLEEVEYLLKTVDREPCFVTDEASYKQHLFSATSPTLYSDDRNALIEKLKSRKVAPLPKLKKLALPELKKLLKESIAKEKHERLAKQVASLKIREKDQEVLDTFAEISNGSYYDTPLMLEWNTWRAMTILDHGDIHANLTFDDNGEPQATAPGNMADIVCDYGDFSLAVEVTLQTGQRQYEMEGEPVSRHLALLKKQKDGKDAYCFFIAPTINAACIAHFFMLYRTKIAFYGGYSAIVPITLKDFVTMVRLSCQAPERPSPQFIRNFCEYARHTAWNAENEVEWYQKLAAKTRHWLE